MKKTLIIVLSVLLAVAMLLCSCETTEISQEVSDFSAEESTPVEESVSKDIIPEKKSLNREINVLCTDWTSASIIAYTGEILYSTEENASAVDVAKKAVIDWVETEYDCTIDGILTKDNPVTIMTNMVTTGTYSYDIVFHAANTMCSMVSNGLLTDLNKVSTLHLENSWWDQNAVRDLSIANHLYFVNGDINTYDDLGTWVLLFNKTLKEKMNIDEDFYASARNKNGWTFDHIIELCKDRTYDSNGDGVVDEFDTWAFGTETYNTYVTCVAGGIKIAEKDDADIPYLTIEKKREQTFNILQKCVDFYNSADVMVANGGKYNKYASPWEETVLKAFTEGRELFYECGLLHVATFRSMDDEFGILPIPMSVEGQDDYYTTVSTGNASFMAIPFGVPDVEDLGLVIEAIAMKSQELVTPEFYEIQLKYRDFHDDESAEMLDLIFASRSFDIGAMFSWGNMLGQYTAQDTNFASRFDAVIDTANNALEDMLTDITFN